MVIDINSHENVSSDIMIQNADTEPQFTLTEELKLINAIQTGDKNAAVKLADGNSRFVISVAKMFQNQGLTLQELIEEGNKGIIEAARMYDEKGGDKFLLFALPWIRKSIQQALCVPQAEESGCHICSLNSNKK